MAVIKLGFKAVLYTNTGGSYTTPTWSPVTNIADCAITADMDEVDGSTRISSVKMQEPAQLGLEVAGKIRSDDSDTNGFIIFETAFLTRAVIDLLVLDESISTNGGRGYRFDSKVFKFGEDQALNGVLFREFSLKPCVSANAPSKAVITSGSPVFTAL